MAIKEASFQSQLEILKASHKEFKHSNTLLKTELATALSHNTSSTVTKIEAPADLVQREHLQRVEGECE